MNFNMSVNVVIVFEYLGKNFYINGLRYYLLDSNFYCLLINLFTCACCNCYYRTFKFCFSLTKYVILTNVREKHLLAFNDSERYHKAISLWHLDVG
jgi:hypothetical protein